MSYLTRRYKRRNRRPRWSCKKHKDFCALMDSFGYSQVIDNLTVEEIKYKIQPYLLWLKRHYELVLLKTNPDYRSGFATYGYDEEWIKSKLFYISDRWQCSFRVRWIINLLDPNYDYSSFNSNT